MSGYYGGSPRVSLRVPVTPMVRRIMITLCAIYLVQIALFVLAPEIYNSIVPYTYLVHGAVFEQAHVWTLATYAALHEVHPQPLLDLVICGGAVWAIIALYKSRFGQREFFLFLILAFALTMLVGAIGYGGAFHLGGNLLGLYFFGHLFETRWGGRRFLLFFALCAVAGGLFSTAMWYLLPHLSGPMVIGSSAGTLGLIAAFAVYFSDENVMYGLVVPIKGKYLLMIVILFDLIGLIGGGNVAVFAHFGGIIAGLLLCTGYWRPSKVKRWIRKKSGRPDKPTRSGKHLRLVKDDDDEPPRYLH